MNSSRKFNVFSDYHQFYLMDAVAEPAIPETATSRDIERRLRTAPHIVVFQTESATTVPVEVTFVETPLTADGVWEHVASFSLSLPSGVAVLCGCTDYVPQCPRIEVPPAAYVGQAYFAGEKLGGERYSIVLWPSSNAVQPGIQPDGTASGGSAG